LVIISHFKETLDVPKSFSLAQLLVAIAHCPMSVARLTQEMGGKPPHSLNLIVFTSLRFKQRKIFFFLLGRKNLLRF
jgi:hypothetical protein